MVKYYKAENELLGDWIKQVSYDLRTAEDYLDNNEDYAKRNVCYHSQQAIEKSLKAYIIASNKDFPDSHNLEQLQKQCEDLDNSFAEIKPLNLRKLSGFASDARYPQLEPERKKITLDDAKEAYNSAVKVNNFVIKRINEISPVILEKETKMSSPLIPRTLLKISRTSRSLQLNSERNLTKTPTLIN